MNERLKELAEQAGWTIVMGTRQPIDQRDYVVGPEQAKKFAELIVRDCLDIIEQDLETNTEKAKTDNEGRIWTNAQLTFSRVIRNRFGVKE